MVQGSIDFLDKAQQEVMLAHIIRCPMFYTFVSSGRITQDDFDWVYLRAAFQCLVGVITIQGSDDHAATIEAMMDQYKMIRNAAALSPPEEDQVLNFFVYAFNLSVSPAYYRGKLEDFLGQMRVYREVRKLKAPDWRTVSDKIQTVAFSAKLSAGRPYNPLSSYEQTPVNDTVPTGIRTLDRNLPGGGLGRKEYGILCAYTGVGKTTLGINFCWGAARARRKACLATLELDKYKCQERLFSLVGDYDYDAIRYGRVPLQTREECWEEACQRVRERGGEFADYIQIWDFSQEVCSISTLEEWVKREIAEDPTNPPQMLVIDWLLCLDEDVKTFRPGEMRDKEVRHKLQRYSSEISKRLAIKYQMAVWATHQADAKAEGVEIVTTKHSAEAKSAAWKCSVFLGVGTTLEQRDQGIFTATASKTRDGRTFSKQIRGRLDRQIFESIDEEGDDPSADQIYNSGVYESVLADDTGGATEVPPPVESNNEEREPPPPIDDDAPPPPPPGYRGNRAAQPAR